MKRRAASVARGAIGAVVSVPGASSPPNLQVFACSVTLLDTYKETFAGHVNKVLEFLQPVAVKGKLSLTHNAGTASSAVSCRGGDFHETAANVPLILCM